jgi:hypothetical protein
MKPTEQRGGTTPDEAEARRKGEWVESTTEGIVPAELGGSDAPEELLADDSDLSDAVLGASTGSPAPATEGGIAADAGDAADATRHGGPSVEPGVEPDLKDAAATQLRPRP